MYPSHHQNNFSSFARLTNWGDLQAFNEDFEYNNLPMFPIPNIPEQEPNLNLEKYNQLEKTAFFDEKNWDNQNYFPPMTEQEPQKLISLQEIENNNPLILEFGPTEYNQGGNDFLLSEPYTQAQEPITIKNEENIPNEEEVDRQFHQVFDSFDFSCEDISNVLSPEIEEEKNEGEDEDITQISQGTVYLSELKKDQVVNRNIASNTKSSKPHVKVQGFGPVKSIKLVIVYNGKFGVEGKEFDYTNEPLPLPEKFLQPSEFEPEKGKSDYFVIHKAKFFKDGNIGQLYNFFENYHKCKTSRLKDHPFKKNLGLRIKVQLENGKSFEKDFPNIFTLDGHRDSWKASKQKPSTPTSPQTPKFEDLMKSRNSNSKRVKESLGFNLPDASSMKRRRVH